MHFWQLVARKLPFGRNFWRVKYFFSGAMPELMSKRLASSCGTSGAEGRRVCPLLTKNSRKLSRSSFSPVHFIVGKFLSFLHFAGDGRKIKNSSPPLLPLRSRRDESRTFRGTTQIAAPWDAAAFAGLTHRVRRRSSRRWLGGGCDAPGLPKAFQPGAFSLGAAVQH